LKQTQVNSCSIFGSEHCNSGQFKDFKASTIAMKSSVMKSSVRYQIRRTIYWVGLEYTVQAN